MGKQKDSWRNNSNGDGSPTSSEKEKSFVPDKEIVDLENEESINQDTQVREGVLIQEERSYQNETNNPSYSEKTISQFVFEAHRSSNILNLQSYKFVKAKATQFQSMNDLVKQYTQKRAQKIEENQRLMKEARKICSDKVSLLTVKDPAKNVLNVSLTEKYQVTNG